MTRHDSGRDANTQNSFFYENFSPTTIKKGSPWFLNRSKQRLNLYYSLFLFSTLHKGKKRNGVSKVNFHDYNEVNLGSLRKCLSVSFLLILFTISFFSQFGFELPFEARGNNQSRTKFTFWDPWEFSGRISRKWNNGFEFTFFSLWMIV